MRLFVALTLPDREKQRLWAAAEALRERDLPVRWVPEENYHLTLKFLGEVVPERLEAVERALQAAAASNAPFTLRLGGFGAFPTIRRPRVIWVAADASAEIRCLKQDVEWGLKGAGFDRETRSFHPHVTLGRATGEGGAGDFRGLDELAAGLDHTAETAVDGLSLVRSRTTPAGPRYSELSRIPLQHGS